MKEGSYGFVCPTCKQQYKDLIRHGKKHHPYEMTNDPAWSKVVGIHASGKEENAAPPPPPKPSVKEDREVMWDNPMPYRGILLLHFEARSFSEAQRAVKDLLPQLRTITKPKKIQLELDQVHERF